MLHLLGNESYQKNSYFLMHPGTKPVIKSSSRLNMKILILFGALGIFMEDFINVLIKIIPSGATNTTTQYFLAQCHLMSLQSFSHKELGQLRALYQQAATKSNTHKQITGKELKKQVATKATQKNVPYMQKVKKPHHSKPVNCNSRRKRQVHWTSHLPTSLPA